jgi:hypothetical protein
MPRLSVSSLSRVAMRSVTASSSMTQGPLTRKKGLSVFIGCHLQDELEAMI